MLGSWRYAHIPGTVYPIVAHSALVVRPVKNHQIPLLSTHAISHLKLSIPRKSLLCIFPLYVAPIPYPRLTSFFNSYTFNI